MSINPIFKSSPKIFQNYKSECPSQTVSAVKKSLKKLGVNLNNLKYASERVGEDFPIYKAQLDYNGQYVAGGKGLSYKLSEASAYAETAERIPCNMSSLNAVINLQIDQKEKWLRGYVHGSEDKIKNAVKINEFFKNFSFVDVREVKITDMAKEWVDAFSLTEDRYKKVPHLLIRDISSSNGCAAGNTLEEAIFQAFCEVCERYACIEHHINRLSAPTVDSSTIKNKDIHKAIDLFNSMNIDIEIKDLTFGNKIPTMGILFTNQNLAHERNTLKKKMFYRTLHVGSHLNLNQAILRCFVEEWQTSAIGLQTFMYHREMNIADQFFSDKEKRKIIEYFNKDFGPLILLNRSFENYDFIDDNSPAISFDSLTSHETDDFSKDIEIIKEISKKNGWETMFIDYSIPELPLKIVKVIIPSVSDTLRYYYAKAKGQISFSAQKPMPSSLKSFCSDKKTDVNELISAAKNENSFKKFLEDANLNLKDLLAVGEGELIENLVKPHPFLSASPFEILTVLRTGYLVLGNRKKYLKANDLLETYL